MVGTLRILGYDRSTTGPDLAQVGASEQIVSHVGPNSPSAGSSPAQDFIAYAARAFVGNWFSPAAIRYGVWAASSTGAAPGALLGRTGQINPSVNYVDAAGGQRLTGNFETPFIISAGSVVAAGLAASGNPAGVAMYQAQDISQPNENFYRKGISGNSLESAPGSSVTNEGQIAIAILGEYNVAPSSPTNMSPSGTIDTRTPNIAADFNDANTTLNNGASWDIPIETQIQVRDSTDIIWDYTYTTSQVERSSGRTIRRYAGPALNFYAPNSYRIRHRDRAGAWGAWSGYIAFTVQHSNRSPNLPTAFSGVGDISGTRVITTGAAFTDPDLPYLPDGQAWERFEAKQRIIRRVSDNALVTNSGVVTTSTAERNARRSNWPAFTLPAWDTWYRVYERHRDRSGAWSGYATALVRAVSGASVDAPATPTGRITNLSAPGNVMAIYRSTGGLNANGARVQLRTSTGAIITESGIISVSTAPNAWLVLSWPGSFGSLDPGTEYQITVTARDTAGNWSAPSPPTVIVTNADPNMPTLYAPTDGRVISYIPHLSVRASDPDQPSSDLTVTIEGYSENETLLGSYVASYNPQPGVTTVHTLETAPFVSGFGVHKWRARASDSHRYGPWSPMFTFTYAAVPSVTITSPTSPVSTSQPVFQWTTASQVRWRLQGYDGDRLVYDTGEIANGDRAHTISGSRFWIGGERWNRDETFQWVVSVQDASSLWGSSDPLTLTLEYDPPEVLVIDTAEAISLPGVRGTHYGHIVHSQTMYPEENFRAYVWGRVEIDGPDGNEIPGTHIPNFARNTNSGNPWLTDFDMTSNQWYRWSVHQEVQQGVDVITSDPVFVELMISFHGTLLHMPFDPLANFLWLQFGAAGGKHRVIRRLAPPDNSVQPMNTRAPWDYSGRPRPVDLSGEYTLISNQYHTHIQQLDTLDRMFENQFGDTSPDGRPHIMCWREGRGGRRGRLYVRLISFEDAPSFGSTTQTVQLAFSERYHLLGFSLDDPELEGALI